MMQKGISHLTSSLPPSPESFRFSEIFLYLIAQRDCFASYRNTFESRVLRTFDSINCLHERAAWLQNAFVGQNRDVSWTGAGASLNTEGGWESRRHMVWLWATATVPLCWTLRNFSGTFRSSFIMMGESGPIACLSQIKLSDHLLQTVCVLTFTMMEWSFKVEWLQTDNTAALFFRYRSIF